MQVDLATMTGNVAQVFLSEKEWASTLRATRAALRPGGRLVFETRDPTKEAWREWNREQSYRRIELDSIGAVESWEELTDVKIPLVSFRSVLVFENDGAVLSFNSTLCFRDRDEIADSLRAADLVVEDIRDAPDRPGREFVFIAAND